MNRFWQKQMKLDELTPTGWGDAVNSFPESDMKYGPSRLKVPAVVKPQSDQDSAAAPPTQFGDIMECLDIVPGISQMLQGTSRPGSSHLRLASGKPQSDTGRVGLGPATGPDTSHRLKLKLVDPVSLSSCTYPPQLITI